MGYKALESWKTAKWRISQVNNFKELRGAKRNEKFRERNFSFRARNRDRGVGAWRGAKFLRRSHPLRGTQIAESSSPQAVASPCNAAIPTAAQTTASSLSS